MMLTVFDFSVFISQDRGILDDYLKIGILCFCVMCYLTAFGFD